jgi:ubiquinone/menaquinone biosynthesis C-methylase UbiE
MLSPIRKVLKKIHPEGIPWPGTVLYNAVSATSIFQRHYELIAQDVLNYCSEGCILDIGTGPGWLLEKLYQASSKLQITGLDISPSMVEKALENLKNAGLSDVIDIKEGGSDNIPFADNSFDAIISTGSIHHWKDSTAGLNEVYRVLKQGGYALMYDLVSDTPGYAMEKATQEFGRLKMFLLWLHAFEEPFYSHKDFHLLAHPTLFKDAQTRFVGVMFCLILNK